MRMMRSSSRSLFPPQPRSMLALALSCAQTSISILILILSLFAANDNVVAAFAPHTTINNSIKIGHHHFHNHHGSNDNGFQSSSSLQMAASPIFIIGPMIRRMRESQQRKNLPMANPEESKGEAPGLRVGSNAWKWPPVWPYDSNFFKRKLELEAAAGSSGSSSSSKEKNAAEGMKGILTGAMAVGGGSSSTTTTTTTTSTSNDDFIKGEEDNSSSSSSSSSLSVFDSLNYWNVEKKDVLTELDARVAEKITKLSHTVFYNTELLLAHTCIIFSHHHLLTSLRTQIISTLSHFHIPHPPYPLVITPFTSPMTCHCWNSVPPPTRTCHPI